MIVVPWPGAEMIVMRPPASATVSWINRRPKCPSVPFEHLVEADAVVDDLDHEGVSCLVHPHHDLVGMGVLDDVAKELPSDPDCQPCGQEVGTRESSISTVTDTSVMSRTSTRSRTAWLRPRTSTSGG